MTDDNGYPRVLDSEGCLYGQSVDKRLATLDAKMGTLEKKIDRMTSALVGAAIAFATSAILLALNLAV